MTVASEGRAPERSHLLQLAGPVGIGERDALSIIESVASAVARWPNHANQAGVGHQSSSTVDDACKECLSPASVAGANNRPSCTNRSPSHSSVSATEGQQAATAVRMRPAIVRARAR
jgi:hypothetical protein